jgi:formylglycine-generating enzyme required for sulfatase activity
VEQVTWDEAVEFCVRLSKKTGRTYRLPSEAEWEYGCRAGTTTPFHFGETITPDWVNCNGNYIYGSGSKGIFREKTTPVGSFQVANAFGLYDMHGNVWEWCADYWQGNYEDAPLHRRYSIKTYNHTHLLRGGAWGYAPRASRAAFFMHLNPDCRNFHIGFRVVCAVARTL